MKLLCVGRWAKIMSFLVADNYPKQAYYHIIRLLMWDNFHYCNVLDAGIGMRLTGGGGVS